MLFLFALALRLVVIYDGHHSPFFHNLIIDAGKYSQDAISLLVGRETNFVTQPYWQAPGYTWFLAAIYWLFGPQNLLAVRIIQAVLSAFICLFTYQLGRSLEFEHRQSFIAAFIVAIYWPLLFFTTEIAIPIPFTFLVFASLLLVIQKEVKHWQMAFAGALLGLAALFRPNALVLLLPIFVFLAKGPESKRKRIEFAALFIAGLLLFVAPVTIRNFRRGGELVLISHNGGINLHIGNNASWKETFNIRPGPDWIKMVREPSRQAGPWQGSSPAKASGYWVRKVLSYARHEPSKFLWGMAEKTLLFLSDHELRRNTDVDFCLSFLPTLQLPLYIGFGLLGPFALVGLLFCFKRGNSWFLAACLTLYSASIIIFFVCGRYRLPIIPFCALFAVLGAEELWKRRSMPHTFLPPAILLITAIYAAFATLVTGISRDHSEPLLYMARWQMRAKNPAFARHLLELARKENPLSADVQNAYGLLLLDSGQKEKALAQFRQVVAQKPYNYLYQANLGRALLALEKFSEAQNIFQSILKSDGPIAEAYEGLAAHAMAINKFKDAEELFQQARRLAGPRSGPRTDLAYARCLIMLNKNVEATGVLLELLAKRPSWHSARRDLGHLYLEGELYKEALYHFNKLKSRSRQQEAERLALMGLCHYRLNEGEKAKKLFEKARSLGHPLYEEVCKTYGFPMRENPK